MSGLTLTSRTPIGLSFMGLESQSCTSSLSPMARAKFPAGELSNVGVSVSLAAMVRKISLSFTNTLTYGSGRLPKTWSHSRPSRVLAGTTAETTFR